MYCAGVFTLGKMRVVTKCLSAVFSIVGDSPSCPRRSPRRDRSSPHGGGISRPILTLDPGDEQVEGRFRFDRPLSTAHPRSTRLGARPISIFARTSSTPPSRETCD